VSGRLLTPLLALVTGLAGCGLKGPLYLPEKSREVVVRPAPGTPTPPATAPEPPPAGPAEASGEQPPPAPEPSGEREPPPPGTSND
jgi:predicted small lipoprotein YifL